MTFLYALRMFRRDHRFLFDEAAELYHVARPRYPTELLSELVRQTGIDASALLLEIGPGTGQLTGLLETLGCEITAVELGERLSEILSLRFKGNERIDVIHGGFEEWDAEGARFDLVVSAQALHWIDPEVGFQKIHSCLKPSGALAVVYNLYRGGSDAVHQAVDAAYQQHFPQPANTGAHAKLEDRVQQTLEMIRRSGRFSEPVFWQHPWTETYDTERYLKLLETFSDHRTLESRTRSQLYAAVRRAIEVHGGQIDRPLMATLFVSRPL